MADWNARNVVWGRAFLATIAVALTTRPAAGLVVTGFLRLGKDPGITPGKDSTRAELVAGECDFPGYPAGGIAFAVSGAVNLGGSGVGAVQNAIFVGAGMVGGDGNEIHYWWYDNGVVMVCGERIPDDDAPSILLNGDYLDLLAVLPFPFQAPAQ